MEFLSLFHVGAQKVSDWNISDFGRTDQGCSNYTSSKDEQVIICALKMRAPQSAYGYLVKQWHRGPLVKQKDVRLILLLPAGEESDIVFICNLKLKTEC